ncbi:MAG: hypothetical protein IKV94_00855 [Clostridia bacterium]|nr:hypothetical protein [Clostridia bacterium]
MNFCPNNLIRSILCCCNPKLNLSNTHYICGRNLAFFSNLAQIENCLTNTTCKCKGFVKKDCNTLKIK